MTILHNNSLVVVQLAREETPAIIEKYFFSLSSFIP